MALFYEEIIKLKENYPSILKESIKDNFSVQTSDNNIFGKLQAANVIKILLTEILIKIKETLMKLVVHHVIFLSKYLLS